MAYKGKRTIYDDFPRTLKEPNIKDIWLAKYPYEQDGNFEKLRPVLIVKCEEDYVVVRKFTTNKNKGIPVHTSLKKYFPKESYLTNDYTHISYDKLYRRVYAAKIGGK